MQAGYGWCLLHEASAPCASGRNAPPPVPAASALRPRGPTPPHRPSPACTQATSPPAATSSATPSPRGEHDSIAPQGARTAAAAAVRKAGLGLQPSPPGHLRRIGWCPALHHERMQTAPSSLGGALPPALGHECEFARAHPGAAACMAAIFWRFVEFKHAAGSGKLAAQAPGEGGSQLEPWPPLAACRWSVAEGN